jgi:ADP-ribose pyrophosphatase YjhB (NUDIX family)
MDAIRQLEYCGRCGAPATEKAQTTGGPFRCASCGFTLFFNAAGAVGVLALRDDGRVLFVRRAKEPAKGKLGLPGGFVDPGENAEQALAREVAEEVGIEVVDLHYLCSAANQYLYAGVTYHTLDIFFVGRVEDPDRARPLDAVSGVEWLDPRAVRLDDIAFDSMRQALGAFRRLPVERA